MLITAAKFVNCIGGVFALAAALLLSAAAFPAVAAPLSDDAAPASQTTSSDNFSNLTDFASNDNELRSGESLRVELRAPTMVTLSAPMAGKLIRVAVHDGDKVIKGQTLLQIDDRMHTLRLNASRAARNQASIQLRLVERLHDLGSRGALDVEMAKAQLEGSEAEMQMAEELVRQCRVTAPWDARVTQLEVRENQHIPEGAPLIELSEEGPMEVEFMMPSSWVTRLAPGAFFSIAVDEVGRKCQAELTRLGGKVDPVTQSIRVYGRLTGSTEGLLPGMGGIVILPETKAAP